MHSRIVLLLLVVVVLAIATLGAVVVSPPPDQAPSTQNYKDSTRSVKGDLMDYFSVMCGTGEGIYYYRLYDNSDSIMGFFMTADQYAEECK